LLVSHSHFVVRAAGAASALAAVAHEPFDLFICDLSLADGDGVELLPRLRSCSNHSSQENGGSLDNRVPAIAISGSAYHEDIARSLSAGFSAHLSKPFEEEQLLAAIGDVMGTASRARMVGDGGIPSPAPARLR
ncbi:MAG: response regulator, partial [Sinobacteraceae bacterium]|nr:response regulator [Nevskiaceae bacterium]